MKIEITPLELGRIITDQAELLRSELPPTDNPRTPEQILACWRAYSSRYAQDKRRATDLDVREVNRWLRDNNAVADLLERLLAYVQPEAA